MLKLLLYDTLVRNFALRKQLWYQLITHMTQISWGNNEQTVSALIWSCYATNNL